MLPAMRYWTEGISARSIPPSRIRATLRILQKEETWPPLLDQVWAVLHPASEEPSFRTRTCGSVAPMWMLRKDDIPELQKILHPPSEKPAESAPPKPHETKANPAIEPPSGVSPIESQKPLDRDGEIWHPAPGGNRELSVRREFLSVKQFSDRLGISSKLTRSMIKKGQIRAVRCGRLLRIHESEIDKLPESGQE